MKIIDSHQHYWDRSNPFDYDWLNASELRPINRDFLPDDLEPLLDDIGASGSIIVQTQSDLRENDWALSMARTRDSILGVVGWVDLQSPDCGRDLEAYVRDPLFVGIRHVVQDELDDDFIVRPAVLNGLRALERAGTTYDLLFYERHLKHAKTVADSVPNLKLVLDHLSKPRIKEGSFEAWDREIRTAAQRPNLYCKLSGLITEADWEAWKPSDLEPYIQTALEAFGADRLMFGSDWPVCLLAGSYREVYDALEGSVGALSVSEREAIFGETAAAFYGLKSRL